MATAVVFDCFLGSLKRLGKVDPNATAIPGGAAHVLLKKLGMAREVEEEELCDMLKWSGYTDEHGALDGARFMAFNEDFKFLQSLAAFKLSKQKHKLGRKLGRGPLGHFFRILEAAKAGSGFKYSTFEAAFRPLGVRLTDDDGDSLARYAELDRAVPVNFQQFLRVLRREHEKKRRRTTFAGRTIPVDTTQRLHRMMLFASSYTRSPLRRNPQPLLL